MGTMIEFTCSKCGYLAIVSGGKDCGYTAVVQTMTCLTCRELVDVLIGCQGQEGPTGDPEYDKDLGICPECSGKDLVVWDESRPCPVCGGRMEGESVGCWD